MRHSTQSLLSTVLDPQESVFAAMLFIPVKFMRPKLQKAKPVQVMTCRVPSLNPSSNSAIRALHLLGNTVTIYHNTLED